MRYFVIILQLLFFISILVIEYRRDKSRHIIAKLINIIFAISIFFHYSNLVKKEVFLVINNSMDEIYTSIGFLSPTASGIIWWMYLLLGFFLVYISILLSLRRNKARLLLIRCLPIIWLLEATMIYMYIYDNTTVDYRLAAVFFSYILVGVICLMIYFIYESQFVKKIFTMEK